ncbi:MAG: hypothetical protein RIQ89_1034 [Bacteroidota bacterium]|jgi:hypothetical protein
MKKYYLIFIVGLLFFSATEITAQHTLVLKTGEKMNGTVKTYKDGVVYLDFKGNEMKFQVADVSAILFDGAVDGMGAKAVAAEIGERSITAGSYVVRYKVADRTIVKTPVVNNLTQERGTVVVDISVDKYGHVVKAIPGAKGSTTTSEYLKTKAKQAAESAIFDNIPTAPLEQKGYVIVSF